MNEYHTKIPCSKCKEDIVKADEEEHLAERCGYRSVRCDQCEMDVFAKDLADHESYCKTRTEFCDRCKSYINVQELDFHDCVPYDERTSHKTVHQSAKVPAGVVTSTEEDTTDPFHRFRDLADSLDHESRILMDIQLQEIERQRARDLLTNGHGPTDYSAPFSYVSRESTFFGENHVEVDCPNCSRKIIMSEIQNHLLECTEVSNKSLERRDQVVPTSEGFDGEITCQLCGAGIKIDQYDRHIAMCPEEADPFGYDHAINDFDSIYGNNSTTVYDYSNSRSTNGTTVVDKPNNKIPCEFCHVGIEFENFEDHSLICLGEDGSGAIGGGGLGSNQNGQNGNYFFLPDSSKYNGAYDYPTPNDTEYLLPCEFCSESFAPEVLVDHQRRCRLTQWTSDFDRDIDVPPRLAEEDTFHTRDETSVGIGDSLDPGVILPILDNSRSDRNAVPKKPIRNTNSTRIRENDSNLRPTLNSVRSNGTQTEKGTQTCENDHSRNLPSSVANYRNYDNKQKAHSYNYFNNPRSTPKALPGYQQDMSRIDYGSDTSENRTGIGLKIKKSLDPNRSSTSGRHANYSVSNADHNRRPVHDRLGDPSMLPNRDPMNSRSYNYGLGRRATTSGHVVYNSAYKTGPYPSPGVASGDSSLVPPGRRSSKPSLKTNANNDRNYKQMNSKQ